MGLAPGRLGSGGHLLRSNCYYNAMADKQHYVMYHTIYGNHSAFWLSARSLEHREASPTACNASR